MTARRHWLDAAVCVGLTVAALQLYRWSPGVVQDCDSNYSMATAEMLLRRGTVKLDAALPADLTALPCYAPPLGRPYQLVELPAGGTVYGYPLGSVLLSLPLVQHYAVGKGQSCFGPDGLFSPTGERLVQKKLAAVLAAVCVGLFYLIGRAFCPPWAAALLAVGFAVGSMCWSTLSRGMWSHTWLTVELCLLSLVLLRLATRDDAAESRPVAPDRLWGVALGTLLCAVYLTRPQAMVSVSAVVAYLALTDRRVLLWTVVAAAGWAAVGVAASLAVFGTPTPPTVYVPSDIDGKDVPRRFWNLMTSPSRGLLVFCPYLVGTAYLLVAYRRHLGPAGRVLIPAGLAVGAHTAVLSAYNGWHGGSCYGPRYFSDVLAWFVVATAAGVGAMLAAPVSRRRKLLEGAAMVAAFGWAGWVHGRGAVSVPAWEWNHRALAEHPTAAVMDWRHPQWLAGITYAVNPDGSYSETP